MRWTTTLCLTPFLFACASAPPLDATITTITVGVVDARTKTITGVLTEPRGTGPFPVAILLSGCGGVDPEAGTIERVNADYLPRGIATLVIDSFRPRGYWPGGICSDQELLNTSIAFRVKDINATVEWLGSRPEIDAKRVVLQGYSHGAMAAIAAIDTQHGAAANPPVKGVIAFYPWCLPDSRFAVPTRILIGQKDDWTPAARCEAIVDKTNVELTTYPNALHAFASPWPVSTYLGHRLGSDPVATDDAQRRALEFIGSAAK